jgi:hypothetical protein
VDISKGNNHLNSRLAAARGTKPVTPHRPKGGHFVGCWWASDFVFRIRAVKISGRPCRAARIPFQFGYCPAWFLITSSTWAFEGRSDRPDAIFSCG